MRRTAFPAKGWRRSVSAYDAAREAHAADRHLEQIGALVRVTVQLAVVRVVQLQRFDVIGEVADVALRLPVHIETAQPPIVIEGWPGSTGK